MGAISVQPRSSSREEFFAYESSEPATDVEAIFQLGALTVSYAGKQAVRDVSMSIGPKKITALIGPSGCGKTTVIRCLNRMNDLIPIAQVDGVVEFRGVDLYDPRVDPVQVRRRIGMVFQKPNPFPKSIFDNVAFGPRVAGLKDDLDGRVETSLRKAGLWDEVKNRLKEPAMGLSGGQQQRLCIARCIAVEPEVILMDEPCSALDPIATSRIEDLMQELKQDYTIVVVTHNMQQAARCSDMTAFFTADVSGADEQRTGILVEYDDTESIFTTPSDERTENYITGRFG